MKVDVVKGLLIQEFFITIRSYEVILDIVVFPVMSVILFGFLASYLTGTSQLTVAYSLLTGMLLWQMIFIVQYSVSVGSLWNIWSRNLSNMFITPVTLLEYLLAQGVSGIVKASIVFTFSALLSIVVFHFNIFSLGLVNLLLYSVNLVFFSISIGTIILGLIFRFGTRIQAFAWGLLPVLQPLTAAFYPVTVLPKPLQMVSYLLPPTFVFEALRANVSSPSTMDWQLILTAFGENIIYFIFAIIFFNFMFNQSKETGQFARLES